MPTFKWLGPCVLAATVVSALSAETNCPGKSTVYSTVALTAIR